MSNTNTSDQRDFVDAKWAFERYEAIRARLPSMGTPGAATEHADLGALIDHYDAFVFDSFGVLNVGEAPIAGAAERIADLRQHGKQVLVLTNAATGAIESLPQKYADLGFDFSADEIISSRDILANHLGSLDVAGPWCVVAPEVSKVSELGVRWTSFDAAAEPAGGQGGFILLSSQTLNEDVYAALKAALEAQPLPVLVGNPDLVAPRVDGYSLEPGSYAHRLADELGVEPVYFGKPFANAFDAVFHRLGQGINPSRIAMIGDTLHTDVLGGSAAGVGTILVTGHGVLKSLDVSACIKRSGIWPDHIIPGI